MSFVAVMKTLPFAPKKLVFSSLKIKYALTVMDVPACYYFNANPQTKLNTH